MPVKIHQINADLEKFSKAIDVGIGLVCDKVARDLHEKITMRTPVDTGRARASWDVAEGAPAGGPPPLPSKEPGTADGGSPSFAAPGFPENFEASGKAPVYITSNLVYMEPLENGHSGQAPHGMVRISVAEVAAEIETILQGVDKEAESKAT